MQASFDYLETKRFESSITIEDTGNCYLEAFTDEGDTYYLSVETSLGFSTITQFGSLVEQKMTDSYFSYEKFKMEYKSEAIYKIIFKWIRQDNKTQIFEITKDKFNEIKNNIII